MPIDAVVPTPVCVRCDTGRGALHSGVCHGEPTPSGWVHLHFGDRVTPDGFFPHDAAFLLAARPSLELLYQLFVLVGPWECGEMFQREDQTGMLKDSTVGKRRSAIRTNHASRDLLVSVFALQIVNRNPLPPCYILADVVGRAFLVVHSQLLE